MEETARRSTPCERVLRWRTWRILFPFLKLSEPPGRQPFQCAPGRSVLAARVLGRLVIYIIAAFLFCYAGLAISSQTLLLRYDQEQQRLVTKQLDPACGSHMTYVLISKRILEVILLNHLCGNLMQQAEEDLEYYRTADLQLMKDPSGDAGVVHGLFQCWFRFCLRRGYNRRWLSSFFPDYIFLFCVVGPCCILYSIMLWYRKMDAHAVAHHAYIDKTDPGSGFLISLDTCLFVYTSVLVMGFLFTTLEKHVVANPLRALEFRAALALFLVLWAMNFLTILEDRYVYSSAWGFNLSRRERNVTPYFRILAALAQVFVTHSAVMLGAVLLGHSGHVRRMPDIPCKVFCWRVLPSLVLFAAIIAFNLAFRSNHDRSECLKPIFRVINVVWPWFAALMPPLGGVLLLLDIFLERAFFEEKEFDIELDYDSILMSVTVSLALIGNVNGILEMEAARLWISVFFRSIGLFVPLGLVTFTFYCWKRPPVSPSSFRNRCSVWFAFVLAGTMFVIFQIMEDCEIASDLPGCCTYPSVDEVFNQREYTNLICDKAVRCLWADDRVNYCYLGRLNEHHLSSVAANVSILKQEATFDAALCDELEVRWRQYAHTNSTKSAHEESEHEEQHHSAAYRLFRNIGQAASVEMYFTVLGVLLKVIFLTQHPCAAEILRLDTLHHSEEKHHCGESSHQAVARNVMPDDTAHNVPLVENGLEMEPQES
ncbi:Hypothetical protein SCF082_LOCUS52394 [Durusdinium trenchii]|uniref:Uncharacterized protein n=1 Tax=Durusdinium trenchii TaxID=1381693 RepID=A0ABP0SKS6_9DINO